MRPFREPVSPACAEARADAPSDAIALERIALHRSRCPLCQAYGTAIEDVQQLSTADDELDELSRARLLQRLAPELDRIAAGKPNPERARPRWLVAAVGVAAAVLLALLLLPERGEQAIEVRAGDTLSKRIGRASIALIGPAHARPSLDLNVLHLDSGRVLVDVEHAPDKSFVVITPSARVRVVGTAFAVSVLDERASSVDVARGRVEVSAGSSVLLLSAGEGWDQEGGRRPIDPELAKALLRHAGHGSEPGIEAAPAEPLELEEAEDAAEDVAAEPGVAPSAEIKRSESVRAEHAPRRAIEAPPADAPLEPARKAEPQRPSEPEGAERVYADAERALAGGDAELAKKHLVDLVQRFPTDALADSALYELGRIDYERHQSAAAKAHLLELLTRGGDPALLEAGHHLLCRIEIESGALPPAIECLSRFRRRFAGSSRDAEVLSALSGLAQRRGGCDEARAWLDEYLRLYPSGPDALAIKARRSACQP